MAKITINGRAFWRALAYSFDVCPSGESNERLSHAVFIGNRIVCSDAMQWQIGILPEEAAQAEPLVVARESLRELILRLEFADKISRIHGGGFFVHLDGYDATVQFGREVQKQRLLDVQVGSIPDKWIEPVSKDTPETPAALHASHIAKAVSWWKSWEKDHARVTIKSAGGNNPTRFEISVKGEILGLAFILPPTRMAAQLPPNEPLFKGTVEETRGQSILDLSLEMPPPRLDGDKKDPAPKVGKKAAKGKGKKTKGAEAEA